MDFQSLKALAKEKPGKRLGKAGNAFERRLGNGIKALELAHYNQFTKPENLNQACEELIYAIRLRHNDIRPYLALCYLFSILNDCLTAQEYLQGALAINPEHEMALAFQQALNQMQAESPLLEGGAEAEAQYESLNQFLQSKMRWLMNAPYGQIKPSPDRQRYKELRQARREMQDLQSQVQTQFKQLEQSLDVSSLQFKWRAFESTLKKLENALQLSARYAEITQTIQESTAWSQAYYTDLLKGKAQREISFELLLDECDRLADVLDQLDHQGLDITALEAEYNALVLEITRIQKFLDE